MTELVENFDEIDANGSVVVSETFGEADFDGSVDTSATNAVEDCIDCD